MATHSLFDDFDQDEPHELSQDELKFDIYLRTREIKELGNVLKDILLLPAEKKQDWLEENGEIMNDSLDSFIDRSNIALHGLSLDDEMMELSSDLVHSLQDTLTVMRSIIREHQKIVS